MIPIAKKGKFQQPRKRQETELDQAFAQVTEAANSRGGKQPGFDTYTDAAEPETKPKKKTKTIVITVVSILLVLALAAGGGIWWFLDYTEDDGKIYTNVYAAGINLTGMTPEEATAALQNTAIAYAQQELTIKLPDTELVLTPENTGAKLDVEGLVEAAYAYGRSGNRWENTQAKTSAALTSYHLEALDYLTLDTAYIRGEVDALAAAAESSLTQPSITVTGEVPALDRTIAEALADETVVHMTMTIVTGTPERNLDADTLYSTILSAYAKGDFSDITMEYHVAEPDQIELEKLFEEHCVQPTDAILDETTYAVTPEILGYGFNIEEVQKLLDEAEPGSEVSCEFGFIDPEITILSLDDYMFKDLLASYSSDHVWNPNRTRNLELACEAINGTIIRPGEVFSFNNIVGERTADKGYKAATVYAGMVSEEQLGGGICQVASTIYYVAMMADFEIVEREEHQFMVDYVPRGMDATIYWGYLDFKFRNNTDYPIRIDASTHDGQCHIAIYGTDNKDYYVEMTYETVAGPDYGATVYKEYPEDNDKGYTDGQVIQTAYTGYTIKTYRNKYSKATNELISSELEATSVFSRRDKHIVKIVKDEEETQPTETTTAPPTTTPATTAPTTEPTTAPTTEPTTQPTTEATAPPTEATEPPTEASTEASTEAPSTNTTEGGSE